MKSSYLDVSDLFCGCGGSSLAAEMCGGEVRLALNHDQLAIDVHSANFPKADNRRTDISTADPRWYPTTRVLIASPECTNHSLAKGKPRQYYTQDLFGNVLIDEQEERSRATMWDVPRFAEYHDYELIVVENVVDAGQWVMWDAWLHAMQLLGYEYEPVYFNSMFAHPTPQSRDRLYVVFWKKGMRRPDLDFRPTAPCYNCGRDVEAVQTWKKARRWGRYEGVHGKGQYFYACPSCHRKVFPYHYAALNAIDPTIPAQRIGDRKAPLRPKTMARIRAGIQKYGADPLLITTRYTSGEECRARNALADVIPTQPGGSSHAVALPWLVQTSYSQSGDRRVTSSVSPLPTQTARQSLAMIAPFLVRLGKMANEQSAADALFTQTTAQTVGLVTPGFVANLHGTSGVSGLEEPLLCVTAGGNHHALVLPSTFLAYYNSSHDQVSSLADPVGTMTTVERTALLQGDISTDPNDWYFRMLDVPEIGRTMAFPENYIVFGTNKDMVRMYGQAVTPPAMQMILDRGFAILQ